MAPKTSGIAPVGNNNYQTTVTTNTDGSLSAVTYRVDKDGGNPVEVSKVTGATATSPGTRTPGAGATDAEKKAFADPKSPERQAYSQQVLSTKPYGNTPTAEQTKTLNGAAGKSNTATNTEGGNPQGGNAQPTAADKESFGKENESFKEGTRLEYGNAKYPLDLSSENQDCIKFSILEYRPSLASAASGASGSSATGVSRGVTIDKSGNPTVGTKILGTITLPIPAGINDSNQVSWQEDTLNKLKETLGSVATGYISQGAEGGGAALNNATGSFSEAVKSGEAQQGITGLIAGYAIGSDKFQQRAYGSIFNNNLELLFNSPSLRSFSFTFKLSPRNAKEAKEIMKIIRYFKQAMSVKRSKASLLLKSPRTFAISYLTSNKQHPYLNKFKECALTNFGVDYTPEGQYMTYMSSNIDERSMISYNITLQFQELEPVFDDEYNNETTITNIGY